MPWLGDWGLQNISINCYKTPEIQTMHDSMCWLAHNAYTHFWRLLNDSLWWQSVKTAISTNQYCTSWFENHLLSHTPKWRNNFQAALKKISALVSLPQYTEIKFNTIPASFMEKYLLITYWYRSQFGSYAAYVPLMICISHTPNPKVNELHDRCTNYNNAHISSSSDTTGWRPRSQQEMEVISCSSVSVRSTSPNSDCQGYAALSALITA